MEKHVLLTRSAAFIYAEKLNGLRIHATKWLSSRNYVPTGYVSLSMALTMTYAIGNLNSKIQVMLYSTKQVHNIRHFWDSTMISDYGTYTLCYKDEVIFQ